MHLYCLRACRAFVFVGKNECYTHLQVVWDALASQTVITRTLSNAFYPKLLRFGYKLSAILKRKWFEHKGKAFKPQVKGSFRGRSPLKPLAVEYKILRMKKIALLFIAFLWVDASGIWAQRFQGAVIAGVNASQIEGDELAGYDKLGLRAGLNVFAVLGEKSSLSLGMLYSQRGSTSTIRPNNSTPRRWVHLNYVELPVLFSFADWKDEDKDFYHLLFQGGLSYSRLINSRVAFFPPFETEKENFAKNDLSFSLGVTYFSTPHWGFSAYYSRSVFLLYNKQKHLNDNGAPVYAYSMLGYFLSFQIMYKFG